MAPRFLPARGNMVIVRDLKTRFFLALMLALLSRAEPVSAENSKAAALRAFQKGTEAYKATQYDDAIADFKAAYDIVPQPVFLYNIAQSYRLSDRPEPSLQYYERYLEEDPAAKNRAEVEGRIAALRPLVEKLHPRPKLDVPGEVVSNEPLPEGEKIEIPQIVQVYDPPPPPKKRKLWPFIAAGTGGVVVIGVAIGLGVYFGTRHQQPIWQAVTVSP